MPPTAIKIPDTIISSVPTLDELNQNSQTFSGGRLMSEGPHVDGIMFFPAEDLAKDSANLVLTRNALGSWSLNRTAAGAETYNVRACVNMASILRTGETYENGGFGSGNNPAAPPKGIAVVDFFAVYSVGVVDLTTNTLRLGKSVFANNVALAQTDLVAAAAIAKTAAGDAVGPYVSSVAGPNPTVFHADNFGEVEIEMVAVMANTGTLKIFGLGAHVNFNYL